MAITQKYDPELINNIEILIFENSTRRDYVNN